MRCALKRRTGSRTNPTRSSLKRAAIRIASSSPESFPEPDHEVADLGIRLQDWLEDVAQEGTAALAQALPLLIPRLQDAFEKADDSASRSLHATACVPSGTHPTNESQRI
ncbi:hypothetical protein [Neisseria subflava]|uniref:hypothetical protein n=1 Tax=Neisseria subflava TaxID=28449 RepID=UPI001901905A|nr:hypothetical protein [Neisseria subflava]